MMTNVTEAEIFIPVIFAAFGFIFSYQMKRALSFVVLGVFIFAALKGLELLHFNPDWKQFDNLVNTLQHLGRSILSLITSTVESANAFSIIMFLAGGVVGLIISNRRA